MATHPKCKQREQSRKPAKLIDIFIIYFNSFQIKLAVVNSGENQVIQMRGNIMYTK